MIFSLSIIRLRGLELFESLWVYSPLHIASKKGNLQIVNELTS